MPEGVLIYLLTNLFLHSKNEQVQLNISIPGILEMLSKSAILVTVVHFCISKHMLPLCKIPPRQYGSCSRSCVQDVPDHEFMKGLLYIAAYCVCLLA